MIAKLWFSQFPQWARPDHPIMRSIIGFSQKISMRRRILRILLFVIVVALVAGGSYYVNDEIDVRELLYAPLVFTQVIAVIIAMTMTANAVATEQQRGTWDTLKLTLTGVPLTLRARWIAVFHQMWWLLAVIVLGRMVYLGLLLNDLTEFQGRALDLYISGITPEVSLDGAILLMVAFMTAFVMQPVIAVAVSAAIGVVLSVTIRSRAMVFVLMLLVIGIHLALVFVGISLGDEHILQQTQAITPTTLDSQDGWSSLMLMTLFGDMGIKLTELETQGQIWAQLENGIYLGGIYLAAIVVIGLVSNIVVVVSATRAAKPTRI